MLALLLARRICAYTWIFLEDVQRISLFSEIHTCCFPLFRNVSFLGPISSLHEMNTENLQVRCLKWWKHRTQNNFFIEPSYIFFFLSIFLTYLNANLSKEHLKLLLYISCKRYIRMQNVGLWYFKMNTYKCFPVIQCTSLFFRIKNKSNLQRHIFSLITWNISPV